LDDLRASGARVFHDVLADGFNLDHVVVSERGIFAIETKTWTKLDSGSRIRVEAGQLYKNCFLVNPNPIRQVVAEADWLQQLISKFTGNQYEVRPVVLFPGWWVERMDKATKDIAWVLPHTALPKWLEYESNKLSSDEVNMIALHLDRYIRVRDSENQKL
jgi:Nuclease-related domain